MTEYEMRSGRWARLLSALAVVLSLVFVGLEVRQNTSIARAQARNELAALSQDWLLNLASDDELNRLFNSYWQGAEIDDDDLSRVVFVVVAHLRMLETTHVHFREGLIPESALNSYGWGAYFYQTERFQSEFWPAYRPAFDPSFGEFADEKWSASRPTS